MRGNSTRSRGARPRRAAARYPAQIYAPISGSYLGLSLGQRIALGGGPGLDGLSRHAPAHAGDLALQLFCTPRYSEYRTSDHGELIARSRPHLSGVEPRRHMTGVGEVVSYELKPDAGESRGAVLVVHGWTSEASFMMALAEPLRRSGFRVVLVDCPAHGRTRGERTNIVACAMAVAEVAAAIGPFDAVVAHSMGALAALMAGTTDLPVRPPVVFERYYLVAAANRFQEVTRRFASRHSLSGSACRHFERHLERIARIPINSFRADRFLSSIGKPALLLHSSDDTEVPIHNAMEIVAACPDAELVTFDGLGHRRILYAPPAVRTVVNDLRRAFV